MLCPGVLPGSIIAHILPGRVSECQLFPGLRVGGEVKVEHSWISTLVSPRRHLPAGTRWPKKQEEEPPLLTWSPVLSAPMAGSGHWKPGPAEHTQQRW